MKHDFDPTQEAELREYLRSTIRPPRTPDHTRYQIEGLGGATIPAARPIPSLPGWLRRRAPAVRLAATVGVVVIVAAGSLVVWQSRRGATPAPAATATAATATAATATAAPSQVDSIPAGTNLASGVSSDGGGFVYVEGYGLRVTTTYGWKWSEARQVPPSDSVADHWWDVATLEFLDSGHAWMLGVANKAGYSQATSYRSLDGGRTWPASPIMTWPAPSSDPTFRIGGSQHFIDAKHGWALLGRDDAPLGESSCRRYSTSDGGISWTGPQTVPCIGNASRILWTTTRVGYVATIASNGLIWTTVDGGYTWRSASMPGISSFGDATVQFVMPDMVKRLEAVVLFVGKDPVQYESSDDGATWHKAFDVIPPGQPGSGFPPKQGWIASLQALTAEHWMAVVQMGSTGTRTLWQTTGSGQDWLGWTDQTGNLPSRGEILWWDGQAGMILATEPYCNGQCVKMPAVWVTADGGADWNVDSF